MFHRTSHRPHDASQHYLGHSYSGFSGVGCGSSRAHSLVLLNLVFVPGVPEQAFDQIRGVVRAQSLNALYRVEDLKFLSPGVECLGGVAFTF